MKKFFQSIGIIAAIIVMLVALTVPAHAVVLNCSTSVAKYYDRDGTSYTPSNGQITVTDTSKIADFLNAGCTFAYPADYACGSTGTCAGTIKTASTQTVTGSATVGGGGTVAVTSIPAFTSTSTFTCVGTDTTAAAAVMISNTSTTAILITGTAEHVVNFMCVGY